MQTLSTRPIPLRAPWLVLAALVLAAILVVASPAQPAAASCGGVTTVSTEAELNTAIAAFNVVATSPCVFTIQLTGDIALTASTTTINNATSGVSLVIDGAGYTVDGQGTAGVRPFEVAANTVVKIGNITVTGGNVTGEGAGILNAGALTVFNSTITGNSAGDTGGGIRNDGGSLTVEESTFSGNTAVEGGGLISGADGNTWVTNSTFSGNTASSAGGGIQVVSGGGTTRLDSVTIANNTASIGSGIRVAIFGTAVLTNTLLGDNNGSADCDVSFGTISGAYNLVESWSDRCDQMWFGLPNNNNNLVEVDPNLGPLANNGGSTLTHLPNAGSPVIDAGDTALTTDQRGIARPQGAADDIGAVEVACPASPWDVANEGELNFAIGCYNGQTAPGVYTINITQNITLTASTTVISNTTAGPELQILGDGNTVDGQGTAGVRPFEIAANTLVRIGNITVTGGNVTGEGGGILNSGTLTVYNSTITGNSASGTGGGIRNNGGSLTVEDSTFSGNTANEGGGLISGNSGNTWVTNSTFSGNTATTGGGGIQVVTGGTTRLDSVTIANNTASIGSGIRVAIFGTAVLTNTLIGDNNGSADCDVSFGTISGAYNLVESWTDRCDMMWFGLPNNNNNLVEVEPNLGPLANNGGDTQTHLPNAGSPVIDAGATTLTVDQRGVARPQGAADDIGAVEVACPASPWDVANEGELNFAIGCYNGQTAPGVYTINVTQDITLTASTTVIDNATIGLQLQILGDGNTVDGQGTAGVRPFEIAANTLVRIGNITVTGGNVTGNGGGILNSGTLTVYNSTITGNSASGTGGGIRNDGGSLTVEESTFSGNTANEGGGLISGADGNTWVYNSTFSGNTASLNGGGIQVVASGTTRLDSVTIANNTAASFGSGIRVAIFGTAVLTNTLIGDNNGSADCAVSFGTISGAYNLVESWTDRCDMMWFGLPNNNNNLVEVDPNLGPLANNGGDTQTHLPNAGSPVIDAGDTTLTVDQRGVARPFGVADDIGAVEALTFDLTIVKEAVGGDGTFEFVQGSSSNVNFPPFSLQTQGGTAQETLTALPLGYIQVREIVPAGWALTNAECVGVTGSNWAFSGQTVSIEPAPGDDITCTYTNTRLDRSIVMSKTVGIAPNVCATTSSIEVAAGTVVYYCYTVTNTGDVALPLHDLVDDQLGTLLDDFAFNLAPGATVSTVDAGAVISITASSTVTNTAVWTAFVDPTVTASFTDTATVTVVTPTAVRLAGLETGADRSVLLWPLLLAAALAAAVVAWRRLGTAR